MTAAFGGGPSLSMRRIVHVPGQLVLFDDVADGGVDVRQLSCGRLGLGGIGEGVDAPVVAGLRTETSPAACLSATGFGSGRVVRLSFMAGLAVPCRGTRRDGRAGQPWSPRWVARIEAVSVPSLSGLTGRGFLGLDWAPRRAGSVHHHDRGRRQARHLRSAGRWQIWHVEPSIICRWHAK